MFLNAIILVLQEILEAALLISVLLALTQPLAPAKRWIGLGLILGFAGAYLFGSNIAVISEWFDYTGQEVINAGMQLSVALVLTVVALLLNPRHMEITSGIALGILCALAVALSITREGAEIFLYLQGAMINAGSALVGAAIGGGIGISIGVLLFYLVLGLRNPKRWILGTVLLALIGGNMTAQAILLLTQADWISYTREIWDSSWLLSEHSILGRLLYALIGYEATPSAAQGIGYLIAALLILTSGFAAGRKNHVTEEHRV